MNFSILRVTSSIAKNQPQKNRGRASHPKSPRPPIKQSEGHNTVTLADIKCKYMYSITCIQRPLKGSNDCGLLQRVVFKCRVLLG